jgi:putative oxidoreductase
MWILAAAAPWIARICLVVLFPFSALDKIFDWKGAMAQANSSFLPGGPILLVLAIVTEMLAPVCIVLAWHDRLAALVLAAFCVVTGLLYHEFWRYRDFWAAGDSRARSEFWDFLKNFGLAGGLLLVVFAAAPVSARWVATHPLSSTPAYAPVAHP